jgi:hypothetical protein
MNSGSVNQRVFASRQPFAARNAARPDTYFAMLK